MSGDIDKQKVPSFEGRGVTGVKVFNKKASELERVESTHDPFKLFPIKIPCEGNCPYMVVTDTLNCRKELEGLADMEEARVTGKCPFWPSKDQETQ